MAMLSPQLRGESMSYHNEVEHADDRAYYSRRAAEEADRADRAVTLVAKRAHEELAGIFARKAAEAAEHVDQALCQGPIQVV